jgi:uncharacterized protein (TIGR02246 family)
MTLLLVLALLGSSATTLFGQNSREDEAAIRADIQEQGAARNKHDWAALSSHFADDGVLINPAGQFWKGRNEIRTQLAALSSCCLEPTSVKVDVRSIRFIAPDIAIVYTEETITAEKDFEVPLHRYRKGDVDYTWKTDVLVKKHNGWKIESRQVTLMNQAVVPHKSPPKR